MLSTLKRSIRHPLFIRAPFNTHRSYAVSSTTTAKPEGDISSVFVSLSGAEAQPLPQRFADLKGRLPISCGYLRYSYMSSYSGSRWLRIGVKFKGSANSLTDRKVTPRPLKHGHTTGAAKLNVNLRDDCVCYRLIPAQMKSLRFWWGRGKLPR